MGIDYAVYCGLDVGKSAHHACALDRSGARLHDVLLPQDETRLRMLFTDLQAHGTVLVVVDQPDTIGALPVAVARDSGCEVGYLPGLALRRFADLLPGEAKTDARDAFAIAEAARTMPHALRRIDVDEEALAELKVLLGFDDDLAEAACAARDQGLTAIPTPWPPSRCTGYVTLLSSASPTTPASTAERIPRNATSSSGCAIVRTRCCVSPANCAIPSPTTGRKGTSGP